jgi:hypothetical protein
MLRNSQHLCYVCVMHVIRQSELDDASRWTDMKESTSNSAEPSLRSLTEFKERVREKVLSQARNACASSCTSAIAHCALQAQQPNNHQTLRPESRFQREGLTSRICSCESDMQGMTFNRAKLFGMRSMCTTSAGFWIELHRRLEGCQQIHKILCRSYPALLPKGRGGEGRTIHQRN